MGAGGESIADGECQSAARKFLLPQMNADKSQIKQQVANGN